MALWLWFGSYNCKLLQWFSPLPGVPHCRAWLQDLKGKWRWNEGGRGLSRQNPRHRAKFAKSLYISVRSLTSIHLNCDRVAIARNLSPPSLSQKNPVTSVPSAHFTALPFQSKFNVGSFDWLAAISFSAMGALLAAAVFDGCSFVH